VGYVRGPLRGLIFWIPPLRFIIPATMIHRTLLLLLLLACQASAQTTFKVGMVTRDFTDEQRKNWQGTAPRPLRTAVWYPAATTATESETIFGGPPDREVFAPVTVAAGAGIANDKQKYPLVLLSHGTGGSAVQMMWLGYYLASRGYIVAAVNHHGNTRITQNAEGVP
jgi:predicted dienelactone hydrolase